MLSWLIQSSSLNISLQRSGLKNLFLTLVNLTRKLLEIFCGQSDTETWVSASTSEFRYHSTNECSMLMCRDINNQGLEYISRSTKALNCYPLPLLNYYYTAGQEISCLHRTRKFMSKNPIIGHHPLPNFSNHLSKINFNIIFRYMSWIPKWFIQLEPSNHSFTDVPCTRGPWQASHVAHFTLLESPSSHY
jgi:hypothetical protein